MSGHTGESLRQSSPLINKLTTFSTNRIPYGLQWMWFPILITGIFCAPESPWWLVRKERYGEAKKSLLRLTSPKTDPTFDADETVDMMRHTNELEKDLLEGVSYLDCFKGVNLRRTEIVCMLFASQNFAGNTFSNYSTYFFEQAGLTGSIPYDFALGQYGLNTVGAFVVWGLMAWGVGRRRLFLCGLTGLFVTLLCLGFLGLVPESHKHEASLATGSLMIVWAAFYQFSVGTVAFSLVAEMSTRRLQVKTVALSRVAYNLAAIVVNVLTPYMLVRVHCCPCSQNVYTNRNETEPNSMELGQLRRLLLGGHLLPGSGLPLLPPPRTVRTFLCRD